MRPTSFFRRPDLFDANLSLSGLYSSRDSFGDYMEPLIYDNSPIDLSSEYAMGSSVYKDVQ